MWEKTACMLAFALFVLWTQLGTPAIKTAAPTAAAPPTTMAPTGQLRTREEFRQAWARAGDEHRAEQPPSDPAVDHVRALAVEAQRQAITVRTGDYPHFSFWIDRANWAHVKHPQEFWTAASKKALPGFRINVIWYNTPSQYVYISVFADA